LVGSLQLSSRDAKLSGTGLLPPPTSPRLHMAGSALLATTASQGKLHTGLPHLLPQTLPLPAPARRKPLGAAPVDLRPLEVEMRPVLDQLRGDGATPLVPPGGQELPRAAVRPPEQHESGKYVDGMGLLHSKPPLAPIAPAASAHVLEVRPAQVRKTP